MVDHEINDRGLIRVLLLIVRKWILHVGCELKFAKEVVNIKFEQSSLFGDGEVAITRIERK